MAATLIPNSDAIFQQFFVGVTIPSLFEFQDFMLGRLRSPEIDLVYRNGHSASLTSTCQSSIFIPVLSSNREALELAAIAKRFIGNDNPMLDAPFFLASLGSSWAPRIVAIRENGN